MEITKETRLSDLLETYPQLKDTLLAISENFRLLHTPMGRIMLKKATVGAMAARAGMAPERLIEQLNAQIVSF